MELVAEKFKTIVAFFMLSMLAIHLAHAAPLTNDEITELGNTIVFGAPAEQTSRQPKNLWSAAIIRCCRHAHSGLKVSRCQPSDHERHQHLDRAIA